MIYPKVVKTNIIKVPTWFFSLPSLVFLSEKDVKIAPTIPKAMTASGLAIFFPESLGMVIAVLVYMLASGNAKELTNKSSWQSLLSGFIFAIAAIGYILSVKDNGVNTAFVVSQLSVVISTLGGMLFLHETKSKKGYIFTLVGLALILVGAILTTVMH